jgi:hypothetical protein
MGGVGRWELSIGPCLAMEGLQVRLSGDQAQPDVVEAEELGEVAGVVHIHQGVTRQDIGSL